jgi:hypothetical protein
MNDHYIEMEVSGPTAMWTRPGYGGNAGELPGATMVGGKGSI